MIKRESFYNVPSLVTILTVLLATYHISEFSHWNFSTIVLILSEKSLSGIISLLAVYVPAAISMAGVIGLIYLLSSHPLHPQNFFLHEKALLPTKRQKITSKSNITVYLFLILAITPIGNIGPVIISLFLFAVIYQFKIKKRRKSALRDAKDFSSKENKDFLDLPEEDHPQYSRSIISTSKDVTIYDKSFAESQLIYFINKTHNDARKGLEFNKKLSEKYQLELRYGSKTYEKYDVWLESELKKFRAPAKFAALATLLIFAMLSILSPLSSSSAVLPKVEIDINGNENIIGYIVSDHKDRWVIIDEETRLPISIRASTVTDVSYVSELEFGQLTGYVFFNNVEEGIKLSNQQRKLDQQ